MARKDIMQKQEIHKEPKYFIAAFAREHLTTDPIDGEHYPVYPPVSRRGLDVRKGDVMLLYCCEDYPGYPKEAPAVGIVVDTETAGKGYTVRYRYLPLDCPVARDTIMASLQGNEKNYFINPGNNYLFEIKNTSFQKALKDRHINWP
jgi:hypothetical protein